MEELTVPPSPNWQLSNILACNDDGLLAYGSRYEVAIINNKIGGKFNVSFINIAHKEKINVLVFSPTTGSFKNCLATCGDDGVVRVWDFNESRLLFCHSGHKDGLKVTGLDWSRADTNRVVSVNDLGCIVCWDLPSNTIRSLHCGVKALPLCLACCPHDKDIIAIGCKGGVTLVIDIKGSGRILHRLRGHEQDVISLSWCPVPYNVIKYKGGNHAGETEKEKEEPEKPGDMLLATGGVEKSIFIWRTGSDGRFEVVLNIPNCALNSNTLKKRGGNSTVMWTCVLWTDAYTLLSTNHFGELLLWDLKKVYPCNKSSNQKRPQPQLLHSRHYKGCFSIACPVIYDVNDDSNRTVWTTAMDKHIIGCRLRTGIVLQDIPTLGGAVYSMALSPLDPNRLAIGSSDSKVFVWNMSNLSSLDITAYWRKIIGKVMAVCWHPQEENLLAFGTSDGHIGLVDVGSNKVPTLLRLHHRRQVYRICWAPQILKSSEEADKKVTDKLVLYSVGDGDILQYFADPSEPNEEPLSMNEKVLNRIDQSQGLQKSLIRSDIVFKPDFSCFAVGNENGSVYVLSCETTTLQHVLYPHKKLMNNLEWHPETVACDNNISPQKDWLATTCDNIKVYNVPPGGQPELIATLSGHSEKIVGLSWSPHYNGRLLSASYDFTVQVWDVITQSCLGIYSSHSMSVMCALFSPLNPEIVISGSCDNTVRLWSTSELQPSSSKPEKRKKINEATLKKRSEQVQEATELVVGMSDISKGENTDIKENGSAKFSGNSSQQSLHNSNKGTEDFKKRQKNRAVFTATASKLTQSKHFDVLYQRLNPSADCKSTGPPEEDQPPSSSELGYLDFFGDDKAMQRLLMVEESQLKPYDHQLAQNSALWRGDISQMISDAITKKQLSDWLVSIAPLAGYDVWEQACIAYADYLVECGDVFKASSYLLASHKVHEAIQLLCNHKQFREAIAIAKCRLSPDDPLTTEVYTEWGNFAKLQGSLNLAAHCYLAAKNMQACIDSLARIKELKSLKMAATLAAREGLTELADSLALECLTMSIMAGNHEIGHQIIKNMPKYQIWSLWLLASELVGKVKKRNEAEVFSWLEGNRPGPVSLWNDLTAACSSLTSPLYSALQPILPTNKTPEFERDMWFYVSGQLAAAWAARVEASPILFLRHLVSALSAAYHFQNGHPQSLAVLLILSLIAPNGLFSKESILNVECKTDEERQLMRSLKAFVCAGIVHWMNNNRDKIKGVISNSQIIPDEIGGGDGAKQYEGITMNWLQLLMSTCSADALDADNVSFFVKKAQKHELHNVIAKENVTKKINERINPRLEKSNAMCGNENNNNDEHLNVKSVDENEIISENLKIEGSEKIIENIDLSTKTIDSESSEITLGKDKTPQLEQVEIRKSHNSDPSSGVEDKNNSQLKDTQKLITNGVHNDCAVSQETEINACKDTKTMDDFLSKTKDGNSVPKIVVSASIEKTDDSGKTSSLVINGNSDYSNKTENVNLKLKEIQELEQMLTKFETERVSVPCPFTAYTNIKFIIDNIISKENSTLAQKLQDDCDRIWKKSHQ